jgi:pimeloyl-ACP methyl ester carboxylesterase
MSNKIVVLVLACVLPLVGCGPDQNGDLRSYDMEKRYVNADRADVGVVVILPGITGEDRAPRDVREGLYKAGIPYALVIFRWGTPIPGLCMLIDQTDVARNRRQGEELASHLAAYQQKHPGKPIFLIGHSAGGGITVFALESLGRLPGANPIDGAFLLSSSLSADYDLADALRMTRRGIVNVSNSDDIVMLEAGTHTFGNVDGGHGDSAGRTGFDRPFAKLYERPITDAEVRQKLGIVENTHYLTTNEELIEHYAPAWIMGQTWPIAPQK